MDTAVAPATTKDAILVASGLTKHFPIGRAGFRGPMRVVRAVDDVSFSVWRGSTLGLVGESGCGKSTLARVLLRLTEATAGSVIFNGENLFDLSRDEMRQRRRDMQMIFQDPLSSLNPRMTVGEILKEPLLIHGVARGEEKQRVADLLEEVGLGPHHSNRLPHEFSGGQRQRIGIARALALRPSLVVCDEAVSALDVSIQSQILNLLRDVQREYGLTYLFISHNLSVVKAVCDTVGVMYLGRMVEFADKRSLFSTPNHPYTQALLSAVPKSHPRATGARIALHGDVPNPINPPTGCRFHTRCPAAMPICQKMDPVLKDIGAGHLSACHLND
ncbi:dipeptide ABC transporter ATP-binding protein [Frigidibacter sp. SLM-1]|nr:dipeptide ABC transporter ATP-binding protein [Frigidibacter sp. ROC022]